LFERDCSAQRRHQKVIEESPAPGLTAAQREVLTQAGCAAARAVGYTGAGTVEFLLDRAGQFYFLEMNTRIQVEHPVTEMITGIDLVEWQLRVAAGEKLPLEQQAIQREGHAIEARLYAEVPEAGFLPSSGTLRRFELPPATAALRLETGIEAGDRVGIDYDPMLAKVIARADSRIAALAVLQAALAQVRIAGVGNNLLFLRRLLASEPLQRGGIDTEFIEGHLEELLRNTAADAATQAQVAAAAALWTITQEQHAPAAGTPWERSDGWRLNGTLTRLLQFGVAPCAPLAAAIPAGAQTGARTIEVRVEYQAAGLGLGIGSQHARAVLHDLGDDRYELQWGDRSERLQILEDGPRQLQIWRALNCYRVRRHDALAGVEVAQQTESSLAAPMPGRIIALLSKPGQAVARGAPLLIIEAMKMEHTLCAPADGSVRAYRAAVGEQIEEGAQLIDFEAAS
jgi:3-methylcrotonyl-CoA carboxylase alpha subunit